MKQLLTLPILVVVLAGTALAQMPAGLPSVGSAKSAADQASVKAASDTAAIKAAADATAAKSAADATAAKTSVQTNAKGVAAKGQAESSAAQGQALGKEKAAVASAKSALDLNTASLAELEALPGVGPDNAKKIVDARPFARKDQLVSKKILTKANYNQIKDLVVAKQPLKK